MDYNGAICVEKMTGQIYAGDTMMGKGKGNDICLEVVIHDCQQQVGKKGRRLVINGQDTTSIKDFAD